MARFGKGFGNLEDHRMYTSNKEELFDATMNNLFDGFYDHALDTSNEGSFKAYCMSGLVIGDNAGGTDAFFPAKKDGKVIKIIVRPKQNFSTSIPDPGTASSTAQALKYISLHSTFEAICDVEGATDAPQFGELIECYLEEGSVSRSEFKLLRWKPAIISGQVVSRYRDLQSRSDLRTASQSFANNRISVLGNAAGSIPVGTYSNVNLGTEDPKNSADLYDSSFPEYVYRTQSQNRYDRSQIHPFVWPFFKAICYDVYVRTGGHIYIASGYRSYAKQKIMFDAWNEWEAVNFAPDKKPEAVTRYSIAFHPASPGSSNHQMGFALDFKVLGCTKEGYNKTYDKSTPTDEWKSSGIPDIINSYGLRWGGYFNDRIHMDVELTSQAKKDILAKTKTKPTDKEAMNEILKMTIETVSKGTIAPFVSTDTASTSGTPEGTTSG